MNNGGGTRTIAPWRCFLFSRLDGSVVACFSVSLLAHSEPDVLCLLRGLSSPDPIAVLVSFLTFPQSVTKEADGTLTLTLESGETMGGFDQVLVAAGREPVLDKLGLGDAGVKTEQGYITVSRRKCVKNVPVVDIYRSRIKRYFVLDGGS